MLQRGWPIRTRSSPSEHRLARRIERWPKPINARIKEDLLAKRLAKGKKEFDKAHRIELQDLQKGFKQDSDLKAVVKEVKELGHWPNHVFNNVRSCRGGSTLANINWSHVSCLDRLPVGQVACWPVCLRDRLPVAPVACCTGCLLHRLPVHRLPVHRLPVHRLPVAPVAMTSRTLRVPPPISRNLLC